MEELISSDRTQKELKKENEKLRDKIKLKDAQLKAKDLTILSRDATIQAQKKEIDILKKRIKELEDINYKK